MHMLTTQNMKDLVKRNMRARNIFKSFVNFISHIKKVSSLLSFIIGISVWVSQSSCMMKVSINLLYSHGKYACACMCVFCNISG